MPAISISNRSFGDDAPAERKTGRRQGGDADDDPKTEIVALCRQAESLAKLMEAGADNNDPVNTNIRDTAFERICALASELVHHHAVEPADILDKIRLWRMLALEDALDPEKGSPDEQLLLSIINDIEDHMRAV